MKNENQVCTLKQAKKLKKLGVEQKSIWHHCFYVKHGMVGSNYGLYHESMVASLLEDNEGDEFDIEFASAFTVAELGVMLGNKALKIHPQLDCKNEAIDRADDLINLIDYHELLLEGINERLTHA